MKALIEMSLLRQVILAFFACSSLGGFILTMITNDGNYAVISTLSCTFGGAMAVWAIWYEEEKAKTHLKYLIWIFWIITVMLGIYSTMVDVFWLLNLPIALGVVMTGKIAQTWFLGPLALGWSVLIYRILLMRI